MARTYTPGRALDLFQNRYNQILVNGYGAIAADMAQSQMWMSFPWKQSIAPLTPFYVIPEQSDYGAPTGAVPPDFLHLIEAWMRDVTSGYITRLNVHKGRDLPPSYLESIPDTIGYLAEKNAFRLTPRPSSSMGPTNFQIEGTYKKAPVKITNTNLNSSYILPWDDIYFPVYRKFVRWALSEINDEQDAANRLQEAQAMLLEMAQKEDGYEGTETVAPAEGLALGGFFPRWR
jgi:hypothetical protein